MVGDRRVVDLIKDYEARNEVASTSALILSTSEVNIPREESAWKFARILAMLDAKLLEESYSNMSPLTRAISDSLRVP